MPGHSAWVPLSRALAQRLSAGPRPGVAEIEPGLVHRAAVDPDVPGAFAFDAGMPAGRERAIVSVGHCAWPG